MSSPQTSTTGRPQTSSRRQARNRTSDRDGALSGAATRVNGVTGSTQRSEGAPRPRRALALLATSLAALASALGLLALAPGAASAREASSGASPLTSPAPTCVVHSLPSFMDQGIEGEASSVADIIEVECAPSVYDGTVTISDVELYDRCGKNMSWSPTYEFKSTEGPATEATLDDDGNATVVVWAGPGCKPGETQIAVDEVSYPNETYTAPFTVLPPKPTAEGVTALPAKEVEDDIHSSVATIIEVEFPVAETKIAVNAEQLLERCGKAPHVIWVGPNEKEIARETGRLEGETALETDDDGNTFVVALGASSCQPGKVDIEASLENAESFNTVNGTFEIEAPRPTAGEEEEPPEKEKEKEKEKVIKTEESAFTIVKEQKLAGEATYTTAKLKGKVGETVDYQITVTNTGTVEEKFGALVDPKCTNIQPSGATELAPGKSESFTCEHTLVKADVPEYENVALIDGNKEEKESKKVIVEVEEEPKPPKFTIEKEQRLSFQPESAYTKKEIDAKLDQIVDYRIKVTNTGEVTLKFSPLSDAHCTNIVPSGEVELKPLESVTYTCEHKLTAYGDWVNSATITGTSKEGKSLTETSNEVVVDPPCSVLESTVLLRGVAGGTHKSFVVHVGSAGIRQVTFYLDGYKLKTLKASQARRGQFALTIDAWRLTSGPHTLAMRAVTAHAACAEIARSRAFVLTRS